MAKGGGFRCEVNTWWSWRKTNIKAILFLEAVNENSFQVASGVNKRYYRQRYTTKNPTPPQTRSKKNKKYLRTKVKNHIPRGGYIPRLAHGGEKLKGLSGFIKLAGLHPRISQP